MDYVQSKDPNAFVTISNVKARVCGKLEYAEETGTYF